MRLFFFPANNAWAFVFGNDIRTARPISLHGWPMFFQSRKEAVEAARERNLVVDKKGNVSVKGEPEGGRRFSGHPARHNTSKSHKRDRRLKVFLKAGIEYGKKLKKIDHNLNAEEIEISAFNNFSYEMAYFTRTLSQNEFNSLKRGLILGYMGNKLNPPRLKKYEHKTWTTAKLLAEKCSICKHSRMVHTPGGKCKYEKLVPQGKMICGVKDHPFKNPATTYCPACGLPKQMYPDGRPDLRLCGNRRCLNFKDAMESRGIKPRKNPVAVGLRKIAGRPPKYSAIAIERPSGIAALRELEYKQLHDGQDSGGKIKMVDAKYSEYGDRAQTNWKNPLTHKESREALYEAGQHYARAVKLRKAGHNVAYQMGRVAGMGLVVGGFAKGAKDRLTANRLRSTAGGADYMGNPASPMIGRKCLSIETDSEGCRGTMGGVFGLPGGRVFVKGFFPRAPRGRVMALEYLDEAKARREGGEYAARPNDPWRHDFSSADAKCYKVKGGLLITAKKPLWGKQ